MARLKKNDLLEDNWWDFLQYATEQSDEDFLIGEENFWLWFIKERMQGYEIDDSSESVGVASPLPPAYLETASGVVNPKSPAQIDAETKARVEHLQRKHSNTEGLL